MNDLRDLCLYIHRFANLLFWRQQKSDLLKVTFIYGFIGFAKYILFSAISVRVIIVVGLQQLDHFLPPMCESNASLSRYGKCYLWIL